MWKEAADHASATLAANVLNDSRSHGPWWIERQTGVCGRVVFRLLVDVGAGGRWMEGLIGYLFPSHGNYMGIRTCFRLPVS